jgi:DNA modification methylase
LQENERIEGEIEVSTLTVHNGNALEVLRTLPDESVHCCVTSPPYFNLRDYQVKGQLGLEKTPEEFVTKLVGIFREVRRVLRSDGNCFVNLGDSYANDGKWGGATGGKHISALHGNSGVGRQKVSTGLKPKDLIGIPWRVAFALQADGWWLRQDIIWAKDNPMPESVTDRCTKAHEYIFHLTKSARYHYNAEAIRNPPSETLLRQVADGYNGHDTKEFLNGGAQSASGTKARIIDGARKKLDKQRGHSRRHDGFNGRWDALSKEEQMALGSNKRSVWTVATHPYPEAHFATYPPALIRPCILAGCPVSTCGACGIALDSCYTDVSARTIGKAVAPLQMVRSEGNAGPPQQGEELLQQGVRVQMDSKEPHNNKGFHRHNKGLQDDPQAESSECRDLWVCNGAPPSRGEGNREISSAERGRSSQRRKQTEQCSGKFRTADKADARQIAKTQDGINPLPALRGKDIDFSICPDCGASLQKVGTKPGVVLDCFGGSGTTGMVALELGRSAILIELNPDYIPLIQKRCNVTPGLPF